MIDSSKQKSNIHDITDYAVAKAVVEDFPKIIKILDKLVPALNHYQQYLAVASIISTVEDAQILLKMQLEQFEKIHKNKGKTTDAN